ncbi:cytochrome P450 [Suhomyces tanzawaensis NRRL Y-17324]|uniref:Cytochrome P450 n=1 Tax=Suhomyces tanzawaensis NRRL Y-17324 TaxID=984487 RepID=A0A1E4SKW1_9ASCO|nr:cytochrome P450 [Suhomyces tanzawaensis NRRL Y-17324]ODV80072.1 cytochrome P450 [Suhomyces tanzawaensis NRRL Y-17324]
MLEDTSWIQITCSTILCFVFYQVLCVVLPPPNFPKNIPTIPFYVSFLSSYTSLDQGEIYEQYLKSKLEKHGAVKIYFASRWNILVTRPEYLLEVFKHEDIYAKSGNQKKIPNSVLALYTGDNIISAHGEVWKTYREILSPNIQFPELKYMQENTEKFIQILHNKVATEGSSLSITSLLQNYALQNIGQSVLGVDFGTLENQLSHLHKNIIYVKLQIFRPFFLNFPTFDSLPIPSRQKAKKEVIKFKKYFANLLEDNRDRNSKNATNSLLNALNTGRINKQQFMDNAIITMIAGHENPLLLMLSLFYVLSKHPDLQDRIRDELQRVDDAGSSPLLLATIYETLRLFPPLGQIINRRTTQPVILGKDIKIPKGVYVGYNNFGTGRDSSSWGKDASQFVPGRWGNSIDEINHNFLQAKREATLPAFHGRKRACLGEKFALIEVKCLIAETVLNFRILKDPEWKERLTPAGPVCPMMLKVNFEPLNSI